MKKHMRILSILVVILLILVLGMSAFVTMTTSADIAGVDRGNGKGGSSKGDSSDSSDKGGSSSGKKGVNTGDEKNLGAWIVLLMAALAGTTGMVFARKRKYYY